MAGYLVLAASRTVVAWVLSALGLVVAFAVVVGVGLALLVLALAALVTMR